MIEFRKEQPLFRWKFTNFRQHNVDEQEVDEWVPHTQTENSPSPMNSPPSLTPETVLPLDDPGRAATGFSTSSLQASTPKQVEPMPLVRVWSKLYETVLDEPLKVAQSSTLRP